MGTRRGISWTLGLGQWLPWKVPGPRGLLTDTRGRRSPLSGPTELADYGNSRVRHRWSYLAPVLMAALLLVFAGTAAADPGDVGHQDQSYSGTSSPTGTKRAESVLWWNDGSWWASMYDATSGDHHIFRLDLSTQKWIDTATAIDTRSSTHADVLWDGAHLYVASHGYVSDGEAAVSGTPSYLYRYSYDPATKKYSLDTGFPVSINNYKTETLVIDKDSTGKLWATWQQGNKIYVSRTTGDDRTWGTPFVLPVAGADVTQDDNSSVVAFGGNRIGVMWSNQSSTNDAMYFSVHEDGQPDSTWQSSRTAIQGSSSADDHINLKSLAADGGRVYAAVKTSFTTASSPLVLLLARNPANGEWSSHTVARVSDCPNRPIVLIDDESRMLRVFATYPGPPDYSCNSSGGAIFEKTSPLDSISFPTGSGKPVIQDADSPFMHNVSSTKQNVNSRTGLALLAVNRSTSFYWHSFQPFQPATPMAPTSDFGASPVSGTAPLDVGFTDTSTGGPTSWSWDFGDGSTSSAQNPTHRYASPGTYDVTLTVTNAIGTDTQTRTGYIVVQAAESDFSLSVSPWSRALTRGDSTTYDAGLTPLNGFSGPVSLAVTGVPAGASASFSSNPVELPASGRSVLTVKTNTTTKQGNYPLTIRATGGAQSHSTGVTLQVKRR